MTFCASFWRIWLTPLVRLMRVSSRWRNVIVELPVYWRDISLNKLEPATVDFFLLRMRRPSTKSSIRVCITSNPNGSTSRPPVPASVMASVVDHLHHIQLLHIVMPFSYSKDILAALVHSAPLLEELTIRLQIRRASYICDGDGSPYEIPAQELHKIPGKLFAQDAPLLRTVSLTNVFCPEDARVCFALVTKASIDTSLLRIAMPDPFDLFPAARELCLCAYLVDAHGPMYSADSWRNIVALELKGRVPHRPYRSRNRTFDGCLR
ncbi:hypothetical protein EXIGLDRAFT_762004 [Exidia glandulosa HHB12029]|uniref:F-box domain-containing protein n=1 Tax=Exidia glandulosa HHB12029 TaxID=1314781 RepID=A0A166BDH9_EXIGL|nr:hypothetical protein EXIGLDRAFT_762004 [Exidia glandulosa HHB12029]